MNVPKSATEMQMAAAVAEATSAAAGISCHGSFLLYTDHLLKDHFSCLFFPFEVLG